MSVAEKPRPARAKSTHRPGRGRIFASVTEAIGDTPIVALRRLPALHEVKARPSPPHWRSASVPAWQERTSSSSCHPPPKRYLSTALFEDL
jgi:hypothetical protein